MSLGKENEKMKWEGDFSLPLYIIWIFIMCMHYCFVQIAWDRQLSGKQKNNKKHGPSFSQIFSFLPSNEQHLFPQFLGCSSVKCFPQCYCVFKSCPARASFTPRNFPLNFKQTWPPTTTSTKSYTLSLFHSKHTGSEK